MTFVDFINTLSLYTIPAILLGIPLYGLYKKVPVYEVFVEGAKEGFNVGIKIIPYLVAILVAIGMFRSSGAIDFLSIVLAPFLNFIGMPVDALPLAIIRPLSGSGAIGVMTEIVNTHGADSFLAKLAATMVGSTETTFYVLVVYFGAIGIKKMRHALIVGLIADITGILASVMICRILFL